MNEEEEYMSQVSNVEQAFPISLDFDFRRMSLGRFLYIRVHSMTFGVDATLLGFYLYHVPRVGLAYVPK